ncbi:MAG: hypothetical protein ACRBK7_10955 [Acidimicrobiales bacterium]
MSEPEPFEYAVSDQIRTYALTFPETTEGSSCVNRAFKAGSKNFVFLGEKPGQCSVRLKLDTSIDEIAEKAEDDPESWQVGKGGWALFTFSPEHAPAAVDLERWINESFHLLAPKKIIAKLDS